MTCKDCIHYDVCEELWQKNGIPKVGAYDCAFCSGKSQYIKLPCKVGGTVFEIIKISHREEIAESVVEKVVLTKTGFRIKLSRNKMYETSCRSIGKTVFLTREEAEKALEQRRGWRNRND